MYLRQLRQAHMRVNELVKIQSEFSKISEMSSKDRAEHFKDRLAEKKKLKISFQTFEELNSMLAEKKFKISSRNSLGIKNSGEDDWINSFNIGNIMHLQAIGFDELVQGQKPKNV